MQVEMHDINTQVARAGNSQQGIKVSAVAVDQTTGLVNDFYHFNDIFIKQPQCIRIG